MDHVVGFQVARRGHGSFTQADGPDAVAFFLDSRAAFGPDGARNSATQDQLIVGRVDNGVNFKLSDVARHEVDTGWHISSVLKPVQPRWRRDANVSSAMRRMGLPPLTTRSWPNPASVLDRENTR